MFQRLSHWSSSNAQNFGEDCGLHGESLVKGCLDSQTHIQNRTVHFDSLHTCCPCASGWGREQLIAPIPCRSVYDCSWIERPVHGEPSPPTEITRLVRKAVALHYCVSAHETSIPMRMAEYPIAYLLVTFPCSESVQCITAETLTHGVVFMHRMTRVFERRGVVSDYDDLLLRVRIGNVLERRTQPFDI